MLIDAVDTRKFAVHYETDIGEFSFKVTTRAAADWWAAFMTERWGDRTWVTVVEANPLAMAKAEHPRRQWPRRQVS